MPIKCKLKKLKLLRNFLVKVVTHYTKVHCEKFQNVIFLVLKIKILHFISINTVLAFLESEKKNPPWQCWLPGFENQLTWRLQSKNRFNCTPRQSYVVQPLDQVRIGVIFPKWRLVQFHHLHSGIQVELLQIKHPYHPPILVWWYAS